MFRRLQSWLCCLAFTLGACSESSPEVAFLFDRSSFDVRHHPFPSDRWRQGLAGIFNEQELEILPFLGQMSGAKRSGFAPTTSIRLPFTAYPKDSLLWLNADTLEGLVQIHQLNDGDLTPVELGELRVNHRNNTIILRPKAPFQPGRYAVTLLKDTLKTRSGMSVVASRDYENVIAHGDLNSDADFERVRTALNLSGRADTIGFFTFTVSDSTTSLTSLRRLVNGQLPASEGSQPPEYLSVGDDGITLTGARVLAEGSAIAPWLNSLGLGHLASTYIGTISTGTLTSPNLLAPPVNDWNSLHRNQTIQTRNPNELPSDTNPIRLGVPAFQGLPYLVTMPRVRLSPLPVIVAIHGITRSKEDWLAFANAASASGYALIAIDLYQHGERQTAVFPPEGHLTDKLDPALLNLGVSFPDPFINPTFLGRTRDKLNQSMVDVFALIRALQAARQGQMTVDLDGDGEADQIGQLSLIGHSLGAVLGLNVAAISPEINRLVLAAPGANLPQVMEDSPVLSTELDLLLYATASTPGVGLLAGTEERLLPDSPSRELLSQVSEHMLTEVDAGSFTSLLVTGRLTTTQTLIFFSSEDPVITHQANLRLVDAFTGGNPNSELATTTGEQYIDLPVLAPLSDKTRVTFRQLLGGHSAFLDFERPRVTNAAQQQAMQFFTAR